MSLASIFAYSDYRAYLTNFLKTQEAGWGVLTRLAKAAECHRPYLSKVVAGEAHLTASQLFGLAKYWQFSEAETEYLLRLLEIEKATQAKFKKYLRDKNEELKRKEEKLAKLVDRPALSPDSKDALYFSFWAWCAVHVLTSIPQFQTVKAISERLHLPPAQVEWMLATLAGWGSVKEEKGRWKFAANEHHISRESPLSVFHHSNWRQLAMLNAQKQLPESVHFTVVQSVSREDFEKIRGLVLEAIRNVAKIAGPSAEEKMYAFSCDFFEP